MAFIYYVTQIQFEFGAVKLLKQECERVGITRPLIVTDPGVKAAGILQKALDALPRHEGHRCSTRRPPTRPRPRCAPRPNSTNPAAATA